MNMLQKQLYKDLYDKSDITDLEQLIDSVAKKVVSFKPHLTLTQCTSDIKQLISEGYLQKPIQKEKVAEVKQEKPVVATPQKRAGVEYVVGVKGEVEFKKPEIKDLTWGLSTGVIAAPSFTIPEGIEELPLHAENVKSIDETSKFLRCLFKITQDDPRDIKNFDKYVLSLKETVTATLERSKNLKEALVSLDWQYALGRELCLWLYKDYTVFIGKCIVISSEKSQDMDMDAYHQECKETLNKYMRVFKKTAAVFIRDYMKQKGLNPENVEHQGLVGELEELADVLAATAEKTMNKVKQ